jgi:uncharacterized cupredoxin-like copper-binding protein
MKKLNNAVTLVTSLFVGAAMASGSHAGAHGQDEATVGEAGKAADVTRTVEVQMLDTMRFTPASFAVKQGETIKFVVKNSGKVNHEFVLGTKKDLDAHYALMKKFPEMEHADANMLSVAPGQTGEMIWKFSKAGPVNVACLHPGHYDAGMKASIQVTAAKETAKAVKKEDGHAH